MMLIWKLVAPMWHKMIITLTHEGLQKGRRKRSTKAATKAAMKAAIVGAKQGLRTGKELLG
jgi:hypothetical protein